MVYISPLRKIALFCALFIYQLVSCHATDYCPPYNTITMNVRVLFVNNSCPGGGDGSFLTPYNDLQAALLASAPDGGCDVIYVAPGNAPYDANSMGQSFFQLLDNQRLLGTSTEAFQFCSSCPKPRLINTMMGQPIVKLANNNEISGFIIDMTSAGQNSLGIAMGDAMMALEEALITNNDFISSNASASAIFFGFPSTSNILGTVQISNCTFTGVGTSYILDLANGNYNLVIDHNRLSGAALEPISIDTGASAASISILSNLIENTSAQPVNGIFISNGISGTASLQLNIANNTVYINPMENTVSLVAGINISNGAGNSICLSMNENTVRIPTNFPGYLLRNSGSDGSFKLTENANLGTIETCNTPPDTSLFPITFTESCP